jgi:hypothetical protein
LTATYGGDGNFNASGGASGTAAHTVKQSTTTAITSDAPDPSSIGQTVTIAFSVTRGGGALAPTGNVTVTDSLSAQTCTGALSGAGATTTGSCTIAFAAGGSRTLTATYGGDANFFTSFTTTPHVVKVNPSIAFSSTVNPSVYGQSTTFAATVSGAAGTPTGSVQFVDGVANLGSAQTLSAGVASLSASSLIAGTHIMSVAYSGDGNYEAGSQTLTQNVDKAATTVAITSDTPDPSPVGGQVTVSYTVSVTSPGSGTPTGTVTVSDGVDSCTGTTTSCTITLTTAGARTLTATYNGDANFLPSPASPGQAHQVNTAVAAGQLVISEFRLHGSASALDEFVEIYNTGASHTVAAGDLSGGYALAASDGVTRFVIPNGTVIPVGGHLLGVNTGGFSLGSYAAGTGTIGTGDFNYATDIPDGAGVALFNTSNPTNFVLGNRLDAVGFAGAPALYLETTGLNPAGGITTDGAYSFVRSLASGVPSDTNTNTLDFAFVATNGATFSGLPSTLGAPGPEMSASPLNRTASVQIAMFNPLVAATASPNRVRNGNPFTSTCGVTFPIGTMSFQRKITNNTGAPVTRLRFRVVDITTFPAPNGTIADLRVLSSNGVVLATGGSTVVDLTGADLVAQPSGKNGALTLEEPPSQGTLCGGLNSSLTVSAGVVPLANGESLNVQFLTGVIQGGTFRYFLNVEALP